MRFNNRDVVATANELGYPDDFDHVTGSPRHDLRYAIDNSKPDRACCFSRFTNFRRPGRHDRLVHGQRGSVGAPEEAVAGHAAEGH